MAHDEYNLSNNDKGSLNYEGTFNIHIQRTNFWLSQLNIKEGISIFALLSFYTSIKVLNGLIIANYATEDYKKEIAQKLKDVKQKMELKKTAHITDQEGFQVEAWYALADIWEYQIGQMSAINLVPMRDVDDILPSLVEKINKVIEVPEWKPTPGDYDYKKDLGLEKKEEVGVTNDEKKHSLPA